MRASLRTSPYQRHARAKPWACHTSQLTRPPARTLSADRDGNRVIQLGIDTTGTSTSTADRHPSTITVDSTNNLIVNADAGHTIALLGCEGLVVVRTPDATLIMSADKAEGLKELHARAGERLH